MHGRLLAIDYGFTNDEMLSPARTKGTLRAYHRHRVTHDLLANPGDQDLTAHVNFSAIQKAGEAAGLHTEAFCTQPQFLTKILARPCRKRPLPAWMPGRYANSKLSPTLTISDAPPSCALRAIPVMLHWQEMLEILPEIHGRGARFPL